MIFYLMLMICSAGTNRCNVVTVPNTAYETIQECRHEGAANANNNALNVMQTTDYFCAQGKKS